MKLKLENPFALVISFVVSFAAAAIGSLATAPNIPTWYAALEKPLLNPPNWIFGPVWTVLYAAMAVSLYLVIIARGHTSKAKRDAYTIFGIQIVLNTLWTLAFFGLQQPILAIGIIALLLASIVTMIVIFRRFSKVTTYLLVPYLLWVSFASYLNISIALLN